MKVARLLLWLILIFFSGVFILSVYGRIEMIFRGVHDGMAEGILTMLLILSVTMIAFCAVNLWVVRNKLRRGVWVMLVLMLPIAIIVSFGVSFVFYGGANLIVSFPLLFAFSAIFFDMLRWLIISPSQ